MDILESSESVGHAESADTEPVNCPSASNSDPAEPSAEDTKEETNDSDDPFAYLNRQFSNEQYKIVLRNLPDHYGIREFKQLLNVKLKLNARKLKQPNRNADYIFVCFGSESQRTFAIETLKDFVWKGKKLEVLKAHPSADPLILKRKKENEDGRNDSKKRKHDNLPDAQSDPLTPEEKVEKSTTPLAKVPYDQQLNTKFGAMKKNIEKLCQNLQRSSPEMKIWMTNQKKLHNQLICDLQSIKHATKIDGYRNKCDFSFGINEETKLPTVGFRISSYAKGSISVGPVDKLKHVPEEMKKMCKIFENFLQHTKLQVFDPVIQNGHFRQLTARLAKDQLMIIVGIHPQQLSQDELNDFKKDLVEYFSNGPGKEAGVTSLFYETIVKKVSDEDYHPPEHLWGATHLYETILGLKFKISPEAFFQINTEAVEILYQTAIELAEPTLDTTVLDVCCGTGAIGLCFAKYCGQVLGIEMIPKAIADAKENAVLNGITNSTFFVGKAENRLGSVCYNSKYQNILAVLDPPRAGLQHQAVTQLRKIKQIKRVLYISCNPSGAMNNFLCLCKPESKSLKGEHFVPVKAVPIDMFPHTSHCEMIILFERFSLAQERQNKLATESDDDLDQITKEKLNKAEERLEKLMEELNEIIQESEETKKE